MFPKLRFAAFTPIVSALSVLFLLPTTGTVVAQVELYQRDRDDDARRQPLPRSFIESGEDERQPEGRARREGGIPRDRVGRERDRDREDGLEEGLPEIAIEPQLRELEPRYLPPRGDWKLGIYAYNTDTGVIITRVLPGSAAARRGLERGDRIVSVGGYQVGYVDNYLYPLGHELQRQADRRGEVLLLVQNVRNDRLESFPIQLDHAGRGRPLPPPRPYSRDEAERSSSRSR
jgi:hypothetical protein